MNVEMTQIFGKTGAGEIKPVESTSSGALKITGAITGAAARPQINEAIELNTSSPVVIVPSPGPNKRIRISHISLSSAVDLPETFEVHFLAGTTVIRKVVGVGFVFDFSDPLVLDYDQSFSLQTTEAKHVMGGVTYYIEDKTTETPVDYTLCIPLVSPSVSDNVPILRSDGTLKDSGLSISDIYSPIIGIYKDFSEVSPEWSYCDCDGSPITPVSGWQSYNAILKNIKTCTILPGQAPRFGTNNRGDGLDLTGAAGQVMVQVPAVYMDRWWEGDTEFIVFSHVPVVTPGGRSLTLNPAFVQRGGYPRSRLFVSRYYATLSVSPAGELCALSASGTQPWTGQEMVGLNFTNGSVQPAIGSVLAGATSLVQGTVQAVELSSGTWTGGDAAGTIYLKMVDEKVSFVSGSHDFTVGETVTGETSGATGTIVAVFKESGDWSLGTAVGYLVIRGGNGLNFTADKNLIGSSGGLAKTPVSGGSLGEVKAPYTSTEDLKIAGSTVAKSDGIGSILALKCQDLENYANKWLLAAGTDKRFGAINAYTNDLLSMLFYLDTGTCHSQGVTSMGDGCVNKPWTRRFNGVDNGADSIDSLVDVWGTGKGNGTSGQTSMMWRGIENFWGNVCGFVIGIQPNKDGVWNIINPNGLSPLAHPLTAGTYISTSTPCSATSGYWGSSLKESAAKWLLLPADNTGSSSQKRCDYYSAPSYSPGVLRVGGAWSHGADAGVACRRAYDASSHSNRTVGGRLEYRE